MPNLCKATMFFNSIMLLQLQSFVVANFVKITTVAFKAAYPHILNDLAGTGNILICRGRFSLRMIRKKSAKLSRAYYLSVHYETRNNI